MPESGECLRQKDQFLNSRGKTIWVNYGNKWNHVRKQRATLNGYICVQGEGGLKNW